MRRLAALLLVVGGGLTAVTACSDDGGSATTPAASSTSAPSSTTTTAAPACEPAAGYDAGATTTHQLTVAGVEREFLVHLPPEPAADMALIVDFHGANSDMTQQSVYSGFDPVADAEGFVVASPNGVDGAVRQWRFLGTDDDREFAIALVDELIANACVDTDRVFAAGISSGAAMSASLACAASDRFAGFGLVAADFYLPPLCDDGAQRPMIIFHGTDDEVVPYAGGPIGGGALSVQPAEETAAAWARHNGCAPDPVEHMLTRQVVRIDWAGCDVPVEFFRIDGGGHTWPGAAIKVDRLGPTTDEIDATTEMWKFFNEPA